MHGPHTKDIQKVQVETTGAPGQMGYVTNSPDDAGTIHIPENNIKRQLQKAQPGIDPSTLKEQQEALIEDVIIPHERAHIQDVNKNDGEFSPSTEQIAEKEEDWTRLNEQFGLSSKNRSANDPSRDISLIGKARNMPNLAEYPWVARLLNKNIEDITSGEWEGLRDLVRKTQKSYDGGRSLLKIKNSCIERLDLIAGSLEKQGLIKEAAQIDVISNTLEKTL
jgi:hypothetical protein